MKLQLCLQSIYFAALLFSAVTFGAEFPDGLSHCPERLASLNQIKVGDAVIFKNDNKYYNGVVGGFREDGTIIIKGNSGAEIEFQPSDSSSIHPYRPNALGVGSIVLYRIDHTHFRKAQVLDRLSPVWARLDTQENYVHEGDLKPYKKVSQLLSLKIDDTVLVEHTSPTSGRYYGKSTLTDITEVGLIELDNSGVYQYSTSVRPYRPKRQKSLILLKRGP